MNTILIVLIVVVIYLFYTTSQKKDNFAIEPINPMNNSYTNNYNYNNDYWDGFRNKCDSVQTVADCQNPYWSKVCREKCYLIQNKQNSEIIDY